MEHSFVWWFNHSDGYQLMKHNFILKCSMFACLLVAQYDSYNVAYMYFGDITVKRTEIASQVRYIKYCTI